ncbi:MAG: DNA gyrase inhibitor YacG [Planctomycetota bacterium]|jgi:endogenous inhibitor of DNA gyrase (YacG/DUF329 family)
MKYRCPVCKKTIIKLNREQETERVEFFPFCSERCKMVDLGAWFDEQYKVISPEDEELTENHSDES